MPDVSTIEQLREAYSNARNYAVNYDGKNDEDFRQALASWAKAEKQLDDALDALN